jgi:cell fate regulator YaaT (PSP1 superfamily)
VLADASSAASTSLPPERWGDDSDAPTPDVKLRPDTPVEADDPDGERVWGDGEPEHAPQAGVLANVTAVKFQPAGKLYEMDAGDASYARGEQVMVESDRGPILATIAVASRRELAREPLRRVLRRADPRDLAAVERHTDRAREALRVAKERVKGRNLAVKMFRVDILAGGTKALFYFSSEERIDFRDLVRDLGHDLRMRVEMRQTGVRDEAKLVGGIGSCGRELCCTTFLPHFDPVSIKMAKDQGLVLNPSKVSGQCGRLKCCLVYEQATYQEMRKGLPKLGKRVVTPAGEGRVAEVDVLRRRIRVGFEPGEFQTFPAESVSPVAPAGASTSSGGRSLPVVPPEE